MVLLSIFFTRIRSTEGSSTGVLYSFCRSMRLLFISSWNVLQIFLYEDLSTLALHTSVGCISLQNASRTALCYATNTINLTFPNIWHKSSTKHRVRPDWNDKNDNANYAPHHMEGFTNGSGCHFRNIRSNERFRLWIVLFWTKRHNVSLIFTI